MPELPASWDPRKVAVHRDKGNRFLLRPARRAGSGDAPDVAKVLTGWKATEKPRVRRHALPARHAEPRGTGA